MKKIACICLAVMMSMVLAAPALASGDEVESDYMSVMIEAAQTGDYESGEAAEQQRNAKIDAYGLDYPKVGFDDLYLLSKIIYAEAGSEWLSDEWKMCVGEVVLNRVASPEFPDTIAGVLYQRGQYYGSGSSYFRNLRPSERCVRLALRLLEGERVMNDSAVVFQANFRQGSGVCMQFRDSLLGSTYFCYSNYPELYGQTEDVTETTDDEITDNSADEAEVPEDENVPMDDSAFQEELDDDIGRLSAN